MSKMKKMRGFEIKHTEKEIVCTKSFLRKSGQYGTEEYKAFIGVVRDFPSYEVREIEPKKAETKMSMKGLTREFMEYYIINHDGQDSQNYIDFKGMKSMVQDDEGNYVSKTYMDMRDWFVKQYPNWDGKEEKRAAARKARAEAKLKEAKDNYARICLAANKANNEKEQAS